MHRKGIDLLFRTSFRGIPAFSRVNRVSQCSCFHLSRHLLSTEQSVQTLTSSLPKEPITDFSNLNPDEFGTLALKKHINEELEKMPEEEDDKVEFIIEDETGRKVRRSLSYYVTLIHKFLKERRIADAIDVLEERMLKRDKVKPNYYVYNLLINGCARVGYTVKAFKLYNQMKKTEMKITPATYTALFNACANSPFPDDALMRVNNLRKEITEKGILLNDIQYNALIKAYARLKDVRAAFLVVDEMINRRFPLTDSTFVFLFQACVSDEEAGFRHALVLWHKMKKKRIPPTIFSYNQFLRCVRDCGMGDVHETLAAVKEIAEGRKKLITVNLQLESGTENKNTNLSPQMNKEHGLSHDHIDDSSIEESSEVNDLSLLEQMENRPNLLAPIPHLGSIIKLKEIKTASDRLVLLGGFRNVLDEMEIDKVKPDIKTFTILLDMIPATLTAEEALIKELKASKVPIDIDFCNMLIKKRAFRGDYENGRTTLELIQANFLTPDIVTFGVLALCCRTAPDAKQLLNDMRQFGYRLNPEILGGMLGNACATFNYDYVTFILKLTKTLKIQPNEKFMEHLRELSSKSAEYYNIKANRKKDPPHVINPRSMERYQMFRDYYKQWKQEVTVFVPPHPYEQFKVRFEPTEAEEKELSNIQNAPEEKKTKKDSQAVKYPGDPAKWKRIRSKAKMIDADFQNPEERRESFKTRRNFIPKNREFIEEGSEERVIIDTQDVDRNFYEKEVHWQRKNNDEEFIDERSEKREIIERKNEDGNFTERKIRWQRKNNVDDSEFLEERRKGRINIDRRNDDGNFSDRKISWKTKNKK